MDYPILIAPLSPEDGGGFSAVAPDLPGCLSDGRTPEEALANGRLAVLEWIDEAHRRNIPVPEPGSSINAIPRIGDGPVRLRSS